MILQCNSVVEDLFGYENNELIGRNISTLMDDHDRDNHNRYMRNFLRTGESKIIGVGREVMGRRKNQTMFPLELGVSKFSLNGRYYFVGTMRDVTTRKINEAKIQQLNVTLEERIERRTNALKSVNKKLKKLASHTSWVT